jgi:endonuclease G
MKTLILLLLLALGGAVHANGIDDNCPTLTYKAAPAVVADQYLCRTQYGVAYSYAAKNPIYTTELLTADHTGKLPRTNNFRADPEIPAEHRATPGDYSRAVCNGGRCDRGHMTPDQDFSACAVCVSESFLMSNMVPQNFKNNEVIWKALESKIRRYVATGHDVYVITGPVYTKEPERIGSNQVAVPDHLFKVVIDKETGKSIAFYMENAPIPVAQLPDLVVSLAAIELATGIAFDASLDKQAVADFNDW